MATGKSLHRRDFLQRSSILLYEPGTDCVGARFLAGTEYVVFAHTVEARDHFLEDRFHIGWLDLLSKGSSILTVNDSCGSTAEKKDAGRTLRMLGRGLKPRA